MAVKPKQSVCHFNMLLIMNDFCLVKEDYETRH